MPTTNPRPRGGGSIRSELRASRADREQIRRLVSRQPKPKPAVAATAGGMGGFTRATPSSATWIGGGVQPRNWVFDSTVDPSPGAKPGLVMGGDGAHFGVTAAGWYSTHSQMQFTLASGTPAAVLFQANNASMNLSPFGEAWAHQHFDGRYRASFWCGPFWLDVDTFPLGIEAFMVGAGSTVTPGSVVATFIDVWRVG